MDRKQIEELKKILYSKIDQLTSLIGDNFKMIHYDYFVINKNNLEEQLLKIREKFKDNNKDELEVLVMKKDIVKLTKDFLNTNILDEIEKERKRLSKIRKIYLFIIVLLIIISVGVYGNYFYKLGNKLVKSFNKKNQITCIYTGNIFSGNKALITTNLSGENLNGNLLTGNSFSGSISSGSNLSGNNLSGVYLSGNVLSGENLSGNLLTGNNLSGENISGDKIPIKKVKVIKGNFFFGNFKNQKYTLSGNIMKGNFKVEKNLTKQIVKLIDFQTGFNLEDSKYILIQYTGNLEPTGDKILSGEFEISGTITGNIIIGKLLTGNFILPKKEKHIDENEQKLTGKQLEKYKEEKKLKCPYTGIINVKVRALNLREKNTKYSKRLGLLYRGEKLEILTCQKNLVAQSWWYKVKVLKNGKIGWVSTIGVGK